MSATPIDKAIKEVSALGFHGQSGMVAPDNYVAMMALQDAKRAFDALLAVAKAAESYHRVFARDCELNGRPSALETALAALDLGWREWNS